MKTMTMLVALVCAFTFAAGNAVVAPAQAPSLQSAISDLQSEPEVWNIVRRRPGSFAELPVMYRDATGAIHTGRIDRVIVTDAEVRIYDYKTFRVGKKDAPSLAYEYYEGQLKYYEAACSRLYPGKKVSTFIVFTALPLILSAGK